MARCKHEKAAVAFLDGDDWSRVECPECKTQWQGIPTGWTSRQGIKHDPPLWAKAALSRNGGVNVL